MIQPDRKPRLVWDLIGALLLTYDFITVPMVLLGDLDLGLVGIEFLATLFWTIDIAISCSTAIYVDGRICSNRFTILKKYAATWMVWTLS